MKILGLLAVFLAAALSGAAAQTVTDGDTIKMDGVAYRIWGIDAAETKQLCADGWPAGRAATTYMRELVHGRSVACEYKTKDRYGRTVALCRANGEDLGAAMVRAGMAWAFVRYSRDYMEQEAAAKAARLGVHAHDCLAAHSDDCDHSFRSIATTCSDRSRPVWRGCS